METWKLSVERQLTLDEIERHCATRQSAFAPSVTLNPSGSMHSIGNRLLGAIEIDAHLGVNVSGMQPGFKSNLDALIAEGNASSFPAIDRMSIKRGSSRHRRDCKSGCGEKVAGKRADSRLEQDDIGRAGADHNCAKRFFRENGARNRQAAGRDLGCDQGQF